MFASVVVTRRIHDRISFLQHCLTLTRHSDVTVQERAFAVTSAIMQHASDVIDVVVSKENIGFIIDTLSVI